MKLLSILFNLKKIGEGIRLVGELLSNIGSALSGPLDSVSDSEQDSLTHGVESEKPEDAIQYDLFDESDLYEANRQSRSTPDNERHSPESLD